MRRRRRVESFIFGGVGRKVVARSFEPCALRRLGGLLWAVYQPPLGMVALPCLDVDRSVVLRAQLSALRSSGFVGAPLDYPVLVTEFCGALL